MRTEKRKRAPYGQRLAILAVMLGAAILLGVLQMQHSDLQYAQDEVLFRYPDTELIETVRGKGIFPEHMTVYGQDKEYGFVFVQEFTRDGTEWYMQKDTPACYETMLAGRLTTDRCIAGIAETDTPYFILYDPLAAEGFFAVTYRTEPEALQALYDAIEPAADLQCVPFCAVSGQAASQLLQLADFPALRRAQYDTPLHDGLPELPALFRLLQITCTATEGDSERNIRTITYDAQNNAPIYGAYIAE